MSKSTLHDITSNRIADILGDDKTDQGLGIIAPVEQVRNQQWPTRSTPTSYDVSEVITSCQAIGGTQHENPRAIIGSRSQTVAALATTRGQDGATRTGAHPQPEAMGLVTAPVVRLESTLAHDCMSTNLYCDKSWLS